MVNIGKITKTHNLNGSLKLSSSFMHLKDLVGEKVLIENKETTNILTIKNVKKINEKSYIISFLEIKNIDEAQKLVSSNLKIREDLIPEVNEDEIYVEDLISFKVYNLSEYIGDVIDILNTSAHSILIVVNKDKEILIPFVEDVFIKNIYIKEKRIEVELLEGML